MSKKAWSVLLMGVLLFVVLVSVMPLMHSQLPYTPPLPWPRFFGSVTYALFRFGVVVNGLGVISFETPHRP